MGLPINFRAIKLPADPRQAMEYLQQMLAKYESHQDQVISTLKGSAAGAVTEKTVTKIVTGATGTFFDKNQDTLDEIKQGTINIFFTPDLLNLLQGKQGALPQGSTTLDANGHATVLTEDVETTSMIVLDPPAGASGGRLVPGNIVSETSFDIDSSAGTDDAGVVVKWCIIRPSASAVGISDKTLAALVVSLNEVTEKVDVSGTVSEAIAAVTVPVQTRVVHVSDEYDDVDPYFKTWATAKAALLARDVPPSSATPCTVIWGIGADNKPATMGSDTIQSLQASGIIVLGHPLSTPIYVTDSGTANARTLTLPFAPTSWNDLIGVHITVKSSIGNTGAMTYAVTGLIGTKAAVKDVAVALDANDMPLGRQGDVFYDGTNFQTDIVLIPNLIPSGGTTGQYLAKKTNTNYDLEWKSLSDLSVKQDTFVMVNDAGFGKIAGTGLVFLQTSFAINTIRAIAFGGDDPSDGTLDTAAVEFPVSQLFVTFTYDGDAPLAQCIIKDTDGNVILTLSDTTGAEMTAVIIEASE
jgi:hypothetical protein